MAMYAKPAGAEHLRRPLGVLRIVVLLAVVVLAAWLLWPTSLGGGTTLTIVSGHSMEPTYLTGDLVVTRAAAPKVGDIIVYQPKNVGGARVIHRIVGGNATDGWIMKGDNNNWLDPWQPHGSEVLGIARLHLPHVGTIARIVVSPILWVGLILIAGALLLWPRDDLLEPSDLGVADDPPAVEPVLAVAERRAP
jgi:signal peptidase